MYARKGNMFVPIDSEQFTEIIPPGVYTITKTMQGYALSKTNNFTVPNKIYGDIATKADRILNTFKMRPNSTGVLLAGEAGSGKTMLGRQISMKGMEEGMITVIINECYYGDEFNAFLMSINQPAIVFFDEFEKVFDHYDQAMMLTLLDGVCISKKLYILTCNDLERVNKHMLNRPGRLYYAMRFSSLDADFIKEYCLETLNDKTQIENIIEISSEVAKFSFDMLKALVEEMNRYGESASDAVKMLNIDQFESD